ncbi:SGNH/GDSL hydrolase family protein [Alcanivorax sp. JB21]|uniref:SGNH/GDSL hydrolase family protein n=1 Tax=Alcanivorax limicola TaxID=2874102 RepID=UPI001CBEB5FE|nr:SGNH/GDSL hydrolase family protein [Alcanivorax limicola]MBZ2189638.1 SGNH/GDSL hydrolase family protein [Alcanivorax limicola]
MRTLLLWLLLWLLFWLLALVLLPVLAVQARRTRRTALRLPEADGPRTDQCHPPGGPTGPPLHCLIIGESPVAGVGVQTQADGAGPALAKPLAALTGRSVRWQCHGRNGLRLAALLAQPLPDSVPAHEPGADLLLVMMGVNDTTGLTTLRHWRTQLHTLINTLQHLQPAARIAFAPVPPMHRFSALPQPLRAVIGLRARLLDHGLRQVSAARGCPVLDYGDLSDPALLAEDGYHPSAAGFSAMGERLARQAIEKLSDLSQSD